MTQDLRRIWTLSARGPLLPPGHPRGNHIPLPEDWQLATDIEPERTVRIGELDAVFRFDAHRLSVSAHCDEAVELGSVLERYGEEVAGRLNAALGLNERLPDVSPAWGEVDALARALGSPGFCARHPSGAKAQEERGHDLAKVNGILGALAANRTAEPLAPIEERIERMARWLAAVPWVGEQQLAMAWSPGAERLRLVIHQADVPDFLRQGLRFVLAPASFGRRNSRSLRLEPQEGPASADDLAEMARQRLVTCALAFERSWDRLRPDFTACVVLLTGRREDRFLLAVQPSAWPVLFPAWVRGYDVAGRDITFEHEARLLEG